MGLFCLSIRRELPGPGCHGARHRAPQRPRRPGCLQIPCGNRTIGKPQFQMPGATGRLICWPMRHISNARGNVDTQFRASGIYRPARLAALASQSGSRAYRYGRLPHAHATRREGGWRRRSSGAGRARRFKAVVPVGGDRHGKPGARSVDVKRQPFGDPAVVERMEW